MRVAFLLTEFPSVSETFIYNQIIGLERNGLKVDVYAEKFKSDPIHQKLIDAEIFDGVKYVYPRKGFLSYLVAGFAKLCNNPFRLLPTLNILKFRKRAINFRLLHWADCFLNAPDYDVIHAHYGFNGLMVVDLWEVGFLKSAKLITSFHGFDLSPAFVKKGLYNRLAKEGHLFTVNSRFSMNEAIALEIPENKIKILPESLDLEFYITPVKKSRDSIFQIVYVGRLVPFKGSNYTIMIVRELVDRGLKVNLNLIGDGFMIKELKDLVKQYDLHDVITFYGSLTDTEVRDQLSQSDVFLLPGVIDSNGRQENQGLVIQEAQAMCLPVIVSDLGGAPEGLIEGKTGFTVPSKDIKGFADKIEFLILNPSVARRMGIEAREYVKKYSHTELAGKLLDNYKTLCEA